jgi:hypothetical protein
MASFISATVKLLGLQQRAHELGDRHLAFRRRPVDQRQVDVIGFQLCQAFLQARDQLVGGKVIGPDLGSDVELVTGHAALLDGLTDLSFIAVDLRGVDHAIAQLQAIADRVDDDLIFQAKSAEAKCGNSHGRTPGFKGEGEKRY